MKTISEAQIRQVIREELEQYLIEEAFMSDLSASKFNKRFLLPAILFATIANMFGTTEQQKAMGQAVSDLGKSNTSQQIQDVQTIDQMLDQLGLKNKILKDLSNKTTPEDRVKVQNLFQQLKNKEIEIKNSEKSNLSQDEIKKLEKEKNEIFSSKNITDPEQLQRILGTGSAIFRYIENATPEELESLGNIDTKDLLLKLQARALKYSMSVEGRQQIVIHGVQQDLITAKNKLIDSGYQMPQEETVKTNFDLIVYYILEDLGKTQQDPKNVFGDTITIIEALRYLINKGIMSEEDSELISYLDEEKYNKELEGIPSLNMPVAQAIQMYSGSTKSIQENKINKLRQRLNELRGVYV